MAIDLHPGLLVRHADRPDWGLGQVQSVAGLRVTVSFEHAGKITMIGAELPLETVRDPGLDLARDLGREPGR